MPEPSFIQRTARDIKKESATAIRHAKNSRKRSLANSKSIPIESMPPFNNEVSAPGQTSTELKKTVAYIGGRKELTLDRNLIQLLLENKLVTPKVGTLLYLLMEYGADCVASGMTVFDSPGEFQKFATAYNLDPDEAFRHIISFKACKTPLATMSLQLHFDLAYPGE
jgi:hypothetical protein